MELSIVDRIMQRLWSLAETVSEGKANIVKFDLNPDINQYREVRAVVHFDSAAGNYEARFDINGYLLGYGKR